MSTNIQSPPTVLRYDPLTVAALRREAAEAGDMAQVAICDRALAGDHAARVECARVIRDAQVQP